MDNQSFNFNHALPTYMKEGILDSCSPELKNSLSATHNYKIIEAQAIGNDRIKQVTQQVLSSLESHAELEQFFTSSNVIIQIDYPKQVPLLWVEIDELFHFTKNFSPDSAFIWAIHEKDDVQPNLRLYIVALQ